MSQDKIPMIADPLVQATVTLENGEETVLTDLNEITFRRSIQTIKADVDRKSTRLNSSHRL